MTVCHISCIGLTQPLAVSTVQLLYTVKQKGGKPNRKPYPLPYGLRNPHRNLQSENSQDYAPETSTKLYVHEFGLCIVCLKRCLKGAGVHASGWRGTVGPDGDRLPKGHQVCLPQLRGFRHNSKVGSGGSLNHALHRNLDLCISRKGTARPQSQFPHSCVC